MARILVVEDEAMNIEILTRLLSRYRHDVVVASSRHDAIAAVQATPPDLILMDIGIPNAEGETLNDRGGLEATRWIKANEATRMIPIIAVSASAMLDEKKQFIEAGCDDVQSKPFDFTALINTINTHLARKA
ncbi:MAG: response regulator [Planctomycetaceae bacterium]|nr:response regulator [Planctomycetaceae bacterium]